LLSNRELRGFLQAAVPPDGDPIGQLRAYGRAYLQFAQQRPGTYRVAFMTKIRDGVPVTARGASTGQDEGVDVFNDFLDIVTRCLPFGPEYRSRLRRAHDPASHRSCAGTA
jgi:Tetracyclin repressor-like, C-terminal domain